MSQQIPESNGKPYVVNENYIRRLFVITAFGYTEVANSKGCYEDELYVSHAVARIVDDYTTPTPVMKTAELKVSNAPSKIHSDGKTSYKIVLRLIFPDRITLNDFIFFCGNGFKFYDERGGIFNCVMIDSPDIKRIEGGKRYDVKINLIGTRKETEETGEQVVFQDLNQYGYRIEFSDSIVLPYFNVTFNFTAIGNEVSFYYNANTVPLKQVYALKAYNEFVSAGLDYYYTMWFDDDSIILAPKKDKYAGTITFDAGSSNLIVDISDEGTEHWAKDYIENCARLGFVTQYDKNGNYIYNFRPDELSSRAEMAALINRLRKYVERVIRG